MNQEQVADYARRQMIAFQSQKTRIGGADRSIFSNEQSFELTKLALKAYLS